MILKLNELVKSFGEKTVLDGVEYSFTPGKIYGLLGRNGAGKTTLFNCINGDVYTDLGSVEIEIDGVTRKVSHEDIGYVLSTPEVPVFLTAREFIKFFIDINKDKINKPNPIDYYFDVVGIDNEDRDKLLKDYSHGMKTKVQLIVNIIADTKILLLDEPLTSLDVVAAEEMKTLLKSQKNDKIMIFSTHIMELALTLCDEILILKYGKVSKLDMNNERGEKLSDEELKVKIISLLKEE